MIERISGVRTEATRRIYHGNFSILERGALTHVLLKAADRLIEVEMIMFEKIDGA